MMFKTLTTTLIISLSLVIAAPNRNPATGPNELAVRFSPAHSFGANILEARYAKHHTKKSSVQNRKRSHVRRSCPAMGSFTSSVDTGSQSSAPVDAPADTPTPTDAPAPSADPEPTSSADSGSNDNSGSSDDSGSSTSSADIQAYLTMHNNERSNHGANALTWADDLAQVAQSWVNNCVWKHSGGQYGENLSTGTNMDPSGAVQLWLNEAPQYDPNNPQYSHWTQVVWKGSQQVGCAVATCSSQAMFGTDEYGSARFYACEYRPAGNVIGEFAQNVQD